MEKQILTVIAVFTAVIAFSQGNKVAVFDPVDKSESGMAEVFREVLSTDLSKNKDYVPVERKMIKSVIKESEYQASGMVDENTASKLGKQMGADYVCVSLMKKIGNGYFLTAKLVDVNTALVSIQERIMAKSQSELYKKMEELSGSLFDIKIEHKKIDEKENEASNNCDDIDCKNGGRCVDGICECKEGYTGKYCEKQKTPKEIIVRKIVISDFPSHKSNGDEWDYWTDYPDIYVSIYDSKGKNVYKQNSFFEEVRPVKDFDLTDGLPFSLREVENVYSVYLYDFDSSNDDDYMGKVRFKPYSSNNGFPEIIKIENSDFSYKLKVEYKF